MPPGTLVPRDWLLEQLSDTLVQGAPSASFVDLTIQELATMFGKRPSTVRAWVERGDFPGAYKLHGKKWCVPAGSVQEFQVRQRSSLGSSATRNAERPKGDDVGQLRSTSSELLVESVQARSG
ncbi:MAG: hypothetical protein DMD40_13315 [Gemmatimonadetes bacterium]|nr:MAG: hypothetical protein DMD40_13315 [Gemmatimonadota bacterium]